MSTEEIFGITDAIRVMEADIRYTERRLAKAREKADASARARGNIRSIGADRHVDWVEHGLSCKRQAAEAIQQLVEAATPFAALLQPNAVYGQRAVEPDWVGVFGVNDALVTLGDLRKLTKVLGGSHE